MPESSHLSEQQQIYNYFTADADLIRKQLEESRRKCENRAARWEWSGWSAAILGLIIIIIGLIIVFIQKANAGWFATLAGIVPSTISALLFIRSDKANERVDKIQVQLNETLGILWAIKFVVTTDSETQKLYNAKILERLLNISAVGQEPKRSRPSRRTTKKP